MRTPDLKNIPFEAIRDELDRSWTMKLLDLALSCPQDLDDEGEEILEEIINTITELDDYRTIKPLTDLLEDVTASAYLRERASDILFNTTDAHASATIKRWWHSADQVLTRHAVRKATRAEADIILEVASNPDHAYYKDAIGKLCFGFEEPAFQELLIAALYSDKAEVRECAAWTLLWDQPIAAEQGFLLLAQGTDDSAAQEALDTLCYYDSQSAIVSLYNLYRSDLTKERKSQCHNAIYSIAEAIFGDLENLKSKSSTAALLLEEWLQPIKLILDMVRETYDHHKMEMAEKGSNFASTTNSKQELFKPHLSEILDKFGNAERSLINEWDYLRSIDWHAFANAERDVLIAFFSTNADWITREKGCMVLAHYNASEKLKILLNDPVFAVRKSAAYSISMVEKTPELAAHLWQMLQSEGVYGSHADEILKSIVKHSDDFGLDDQLLRLAQTDQRESIRYSAIARLRERRAVKQIVSLVPLLYQKPLVSWEVHTILLGACVEMGIVLPDLNTLETIDSFYVQAELAEYKALNECK